MICIALSVIMIYGSTVMTINVYSQTEAPTCKDPTDQNLPCMMVISTLPAPTNTVQCQEPNGQILSCSYATQTLSNGQQIVVITAYVPASFVFSPGIMKVIVHETEKIIHEGGTGSNPNPQPSVCKGIQGVHGCIIFMPNGPGLSPTPIYLTPLPGGPHTAGFEAGWFAGNTGSDPYNPYPVGSKDWLAYNLGFGQGDKASTPYTNCEHYDTCTDPKYDPTHDPHYKPQHEPSPCLAGNVDTCSTAFASKSLQSICPPIGVASLQCGTGAVVPGQVTPQPHTAAYLQALNSGSPNPYKPGTIDYQHYQAGLLAKQQNGGASPGIVTPGGTTSNNNNNPSTKKCPDGSIIPVKDKCPTLKQTNPSITSTGSSTPSSPSDSLSTPSGGSSSGGETGSGGGSSDSSTSSGGGSGGSSSSSPGSGSSSGSSSNLDSGSHHH
jgi:hypothetical protein